METKRYYLSSVENNKAVRIIQVVFGILCLAVAIYWLIFNIKALKSDSTLWITIIFLTGFGFYQVWSGLGKAARFIAISSDKISLKKTIILPSIDLSADSIEKIEIFPFNLIFFLKTGRKIILRFSTTFYETSANVKHEILTFSELNAIKAEIMEEKI